MLLDNPYEQFTIRKLSRLTDNAVQSVKRAVDVLEANAPLVVAPQGNSRLVGINRGRLSKPDDPALHIPQRDFHPPVRAALDRLSAELNGVAGVLLFGSGARGQADRQSGIDLLVLASDRASQQHRANEIATELEQERFDGERYEFQLLAESPASAWGHGDRLEDVFTDGITLVDSTMLSDLKQEVLNSA